MGALTRRAALLVFIVIFYACMLGIWSRPAGFLASVWPANALFLALLLRHPGAARPAGWAAAAAAYLLADLATGAGFYKAVILNGANLVSVGAGYLVLARLSPEVARLRHPSSMLWVVAAALLGGGVAGVVGGLANPSLFGGSIASGFTIWWVAEVANYVAILPVLLSAPALGDVEWRRFSLRRIRRGDLLPALAVGVSCIATLMIGGSGAIAFPVLALLWCGLVYPVFPTALLTLAFSFMVLLFIATGQVPGISGAVDQAQLFSIRLGVAAVAIAPIMLSIVIRSRNELLAQMRHLATHDQLTGLRNRGAFLDDAAEALRRARGPAVVLMIDLDRFKAINDTHGHAAGDEVLRETARRFRAGIRPRDLIGRVGGEEFAVLLRDCPPDMALPVAERIRAALKAAPIQISSGPELRVTASIGLVAPPPGTQDSLEALLVRADTALYAAKDQGRDRVVAAGSDLPVQPVIG